MNSETRNAVTSAPMLSSDRAENEMASAAMHPDLSI